MLSGSYRSYPEIRAGHKIWLLAITPIVVFFMFFELALLPAPRTQAWNWVASNQNANLSYLVQYFASGALHTMFCIWVCVSFYCKRATGAEKHRLLAQKLHALAGSLIVAGAFWLVVLFSESQIEFLSHETVYALLMSHDSLKSYFVCATPNLSAQTCHSFYLFSAFPMGLVTIGHLAIIPIIFSVGQQSNFFSISKLEKNWKETMQYFTNLIQGKFLLLTAMLFSSSLTTSFYFFLPLAVLDSDSSRESYKIFATSMSLTWGAIFSLTLIAILVMPYYWFRNAAHIYASALRAEHPEEADIVVKFNHGYALVRKNFGFLLSALFPLAAGVIGATMN